MREILFRGKDQYNDWIYGYLCQYRGDSIADNGGDLLDDSDYYIRDWTEKIDTGSYGCNYKVLPSTIGQYTGLTDKNGKKIFEGDIVRTHYANAPKAVFVETVIFDGGKFCATSINEGCKTTAALWDGVPRLAIDKSVYMDEVEVIGNIHDNPELLGVDK